MTQSSEVLLLAFGSAAEVLGWRERRFELSGGLRVKDLVAVLEQECPRLAAARGRVRFALNSAYADGDTTLKPGDELAIIPPVSGGAADPVASVATRLTRDAIDLDRLIAEVSDESCGAIATFLGVVRAEVNAQGQTLLHLDYTAHESMALAEMHRIGSAVRQQSGATRVRVEHRLGRVRIKDASVAIVVSAAHRASAMDACRELIEQLKVLVPIFKQEIWADGGATWVNPI